MVKYSEIWFEKIDRKTEKAFHVEAQGVDT